MTSAEIPLNDPELVDLIERALSDAGFGVTEHHSRGIRIEGAGVGFDDHTVDVDIEPFDIDGVRVVKLSSLLRSDPGPYDRALLACARGNGACSVPKFNVIEELDRDEPSRFRIRASLTLYADHLNEDELTRMTWLFLKQTDGIDNELATILTQEHDQDQAPVE